MNAINNGKLEGWPQHLKTAYVDSGSNVDPEYEKQNVMEHLIRDTGRSEEECIAKMKELEFTDQMCRGTIGALSGGWQMKLRLIRAILMDPDIFLLVSLQRISQVVLSRVVSCLISASSVQHMSSYALHLDGPNNIRRCISFSHFMSQSSFIHSFVSSRLVSMTTNQKQPYRTNRRITWLKVPSNGLRIFSILWTIKLS